VLDQAIGAAADELSRRPPQQRHAALSKQTAGIVRDAALLGMGIGHVGLTVRISVLTSVKATIHKDSPCNHPGCQLPNCKGNILDEYIALEDDLMEGGKEVTDDEGTDDMGGGEEDTDEEEAHHRGTALQMVFGPDRVSRKYRLILPHHKNSGKGIAMPPLEVHSHKLNLLLAIWQDLGRPTVLAQANPAVGNTMELFVGVKGSAFKSLTKWYKGVHYSLAAPYPFIPLNKYRTVFVEDRLSRPDRPGPDNDGAAMVMGNTVRQWHQSYWPNRKAKLARDATRSMAKYRKSLLMDAIKGVAGGNKE